LLLLLLQTVRHVSRRVTVTVVVDESRLYNGFAVAGRSVVAGLALLVVVNDRVTDVRYRRRRLLNLVVAARKYGRRQQPPYAFLFGTVAGVRRLGRRVCSRRDRRTHYTSTLRLSRDYARSFRQ